MPMHLRSTNAEPVGARLARESVTSVYQTDRIIVLRGQASLQQRLHPSWWKAFKPKQENQDSAKNKPNPRIARGLASFDDQSSWKRDVLSLKARLPLLSVSAA